MSCRHKLILELIISQLPCTDIIDFHGCLLTMPGGVPLILSIPEFLHGCWGGIIPGLLRDFREIPIGASNSNIQNEVKLKFIKI